LFFGWWVGVGFFYFDFQSLQQEQVGAVKAALLFAIPDGTFEFSVGLDGVDAQFVLLMNEAVGGVAVVGALRGVGGVLKGSVAGFPCWSGLASWSGLACWGARTGRAQGGLIAPDSSFVDDEDQIGVATGAAQGVAAPILNAILHVENGGAVAGVELEVGDVAAVSCFYEDGLSALKDFGKARMLFGLALGEYAAGRSGEKQEVGELALHALPRCEVGFGPG